MAEKLLSIRLSEAEHRALKLHAVLQGRSVNSVVAELIRAELAKGLAPDGDRSREEFVAELFVRFGIDPASPEYRAAAERADASIRHSIDKPASRGTGKGRQRGVA